MAHHEHGEREVLDAADINRALTRIAHEITEREQGAQDVIILGLQTRGVPLAVRLAEKLASVDPAFNPAQCLGELDATMFRDDLRRNVTRTLGVTRMPSRGIDDAVVVLVDDVLFSGRTVRAALDALLGYGRPRAVRLATLVDRGHRELPIRPDYVGKNLPTSSSERVSVRLAETDGVDSVVIAPLTELPLEETPQEKSPQEKSPQETP
ncbi:MAG: bifunctional pyr operon transcriptional regulator/uracil phosphoribosyltransferase PyrR [Cellulomonadaceae bacterium]|nr:bifunctional pyr operon transcriptional regulator/uracil phosphoribosyltransferase PyrR [Cellulomonadaceae bacterium]